MGPLNSIVSGQEAVNCLKLILTLEDKKDKKPGRVYF